MILALGIAWTCPACSAASRGQLEEFWAETARHHGLGEPLEVKTEREQVIGLASGGQEDAVRVSYRQPPTRRWTRFLLIPDEGQPLEELEDYAHAAAVVHATRDWRTP